MNGRAIERKSSTVVVVEGFFDCVRVWQAGFTSVALIGSVLYDDQQRLISEHFTGALLLFDGDEAGRRRTEECLLRLGLKLWVKAIPLADGEQPDMLAAEQLQTLLK